MNRFLLCTLSSLIVFCSCQKELRFEPAEPDSPPGDPTPAAMLAVSRSAIAVGNDFGYTDTLTVRSTIDWTISLSAGMSGWLSVDTMSGSSGNTIVILSVTANNNTTSKTGTITVSPAGSSTVASQVISITQDVYNFLWQRSFGSAYADVINDVIQDADGGYVFAGQNDYGWIFKTDANGNKTWEFTTNVTDAFNTIIPSTDGAYVASGYRWHFINGAAAFTDLLVVKLDASGSLLWERSFGGTYDEKGFKIVKTPDGGYLIAGHSSSTDGDVSGNHGGPYDLWLIKIDANGNKIWAKTYGGSRDEFLSSVTTTADGGFLVAGSTASNDGDVSGLHGGNDVLVLKLDANGNKIWSKTFGGSQYEGPNSIIATADGGSIIVGFTNSNDGDVSGNHSSDDDMWVLKLYNNGQRSWQATFGGTDMDQAYSVSALPDDSYMVCGFTDSNNGDVSGNHGDRDFWVVKVSTTGKKLWQKTFGGPGTDWATTITATTDGSFVTAGYSTANGGDVTGISGWSKGWVVKFK